MSNINNFSKIRKVLSEDFSKNTTLDIGQKYIVGETLFFVSLNGVVSFENKDYEEIGNKGEESSLIKILKDMNKGEDIVTIVNAGFEEKDTSALKIITTDDSNEYISQNDENVTSRMKAILSTSTEPSEMSGTFVQIKTTSGVMLYPRSYGKYIYYTDTHRQFVKGDGVTNVQDYLDLLTPYVGEIPDIITKLESLDFHKGSEESRSSDSIYLDNFVFNNETPTCFIGPNIQSNYAVPTYHSGSQGTEVGNITTWTGYDISSLYSMSDIGNITDSTVDNDNNGYYLSSLGIIVKVSNDDLSVTFDDSLYQKISTGEIPVFCSIIKTGNKTILYTQTGYIAEKTGESGEWSYYHPDSIPTSYTVGCGYYNSDTKRYVVLSGGSQSITGYYSTDLLNWLPCKTLSGFTGCTKIIKYGNYILANNPGNSNQYIYSSDDINWTLETLGTSNLSNITYFSGKLYCASDNIIYSTTDVTDFNISKQTTNTSELIYGFSSINIIAFKDSSNNIVYSKTGEDFASNSGIISGSYKNINNLEYVDNCFIGTTNDKFLNICQHYFTYSYTVEINPWLSNIFVMDLSQYMSSNFNINLNSLPNTDDNGRIVKYGNTIIISLVILNGNNNIITFPDNIYWENGVIPNLGYRTLMTLLSYDAGSTWIITTLTELNKAN